MRQRDKFWEYADNLDRRFKCKFCQKEYPGGISRVKSHLSGQTGRDIMVCPSVPDEVQALTVIAIGGGSKKAKLSTENVETSQETLSSLQQTSIPTIYNKKDKDMVDMKIAQHFF